MSVEKQVKYWVGRVTSDRYWHQALDNHIWLTQQRYQIQTNSAVTNLLKCVLEVKVGDVILLTYSDGIYAYGNVVKCPFESGQVSNLKEVIKEKEHDFTNGIVKFDDNEVFYEDLRDGCECWGQRIMVDQWHFYLEPTRVSTEDLKKNITSGVSSMSLIGVTEKFAKDKIKELKEQYKMKYENIINLSKLLTFNYNLILTGAPGTGKTYLAKQIAQQMIFGEVKKEMSPEEEKQFNEQCGFVQFHPSYDYTDFVEGLRPIQDESGNVGFERKDGVFKEFCKRAVKNAIDSKKSLDDLKKDKTFEEKYYEIINKIGNGEISKFDLRKGIQMDIVEVSKGDNIILRTHESEKTYTVSLNRLAKLAKIYPDVESLNNISNIDKEIRKVIKGCHSSSYWAVLKAVYEQSSSEKVEVAPIKIEEKNFVFIIDEINRGEISKIFGELFFSIDPGYRGTDGKVRTQYANMQKEEANDFDDALGITDPKNYGHFFVPKNVYIIGTMNDIDRSVESMDFAFRRRFAFKEITAEDSKQMLDSDDAWGKDKMPKPDFLQKVKDKMDAINKVIFDDDEKIGIEGLSSAYHIGASYFLKLANYRNESGEYDDKSFTDLWDNHLEGLLREYMRGMQDVETNIDKLKKAYGYPSNSNND